MRIPILFNVISSAAKVKFEFISLYQWPMFLDYNLIIKLLYSVKLYDCLKKSGYVFISLLVGCYWISNDTEELSLG